ncbi:murein hydrolase activator EnvC family protein [Kerstersia similis]|uniref:murein hydrolase activator EnvC family protein n=1 Tax=Kerstersia similis TaxID=206505 RepID=UPI0039F0A669
MNLRPGAWCRLCRSSLLWLALLAPPLAGAAPDTQQVSDSQREAQERRKELQQRIRTVQQELELREGERKDAADALRQSEQALSDSNRRLHELAEQARQQQAVLTRLERDIAALQKDLEQRRQILAGQLREQYANELSPWSVWLSGGDPQDNGRQLAYLDYVAQARAETVRGLDAEISRLETLQAEQRAGNERLVALNRDAEAQRSQRAAQQRERAAVLARLEDRIRAQRVEASRLSRDDERLGRLVDDLGKQLEAARRAAEVRRQAELRRQEELRVAREKAEAERRARQAAARAAAQQVAAEKAAAERAAQRASERERALAARETATQGGPVSTLRQVEGPRLGASAAAPAPALAQAELPREEPVETVDVRPAEPPAPAPVEPTVTQLPAQPAQPVQRTERTAVAAVAPGGQGQAGLSNGLRTGLKAPLSGQVLARFGTQKPDGGAWRGQLIAAPEGTAVRVIESGTVVYANWLRGFGNIIIVDHGRDYLSVYAHNQSLLKQVGDAVARQEAIALAGATGGQVDSGLYFEVRHRGTPVDPARFIAR